MSGLAFRTEPTPAVLPYAFDTSRIVRLVLRGILAFELGVIVPGIVVSVVLGRGLAAVGVLAVSGVFMAVMGVIIAKHLDACTGTISHASVVVEPMTFCGIRLPGAIGTFPIDRFREVRIERVSARIDTSQPSSPSARVYLIGHPGTPDILIARADREEGVVLGHDLSAALRMPCTETSAPY